jgi:hypothetical protein
MSRYGEAELDGPSPASTHCGLARSEIWPVEANAVLQNARACPPQ